MFCSVVRFSLRVALRLAIAIHVFSCMCSRKGPCLRDMLDGVNVLVGLLESCGGRGLLVDV